MAHHFDLEGKVVIVGDEIEVVFRIESAVGLVSAVFDVRTLRGFTLPVPCPGHPRLMHIGDVIAHSAALILYPTGLCSQARVLDCESSIGVAEAVSLIADEKFTTRRPGVRPARPDSAF